jgi:hypothetical protein
MHRFYLPGATGLAMASRNPRLNIERMAQAVVDLDTLSALS